VGNEFLLRPFESVLIKGKGKGKGDPEGSRNLRFPYIMTTQDVGKVVSITHRPPLPPGNVPGTHFS
jgi:hypothetical protein